MRGKKELKLIKSGGFRQKTNNNNKKKWDKSMSDIS